MHCLEPWEEAAWHMRDTTHPSVTRDGSTGGVVAGEAGTGEREKASCRAPVHGPEGFGKCQTLHSPGYPITP